MYRGMGFDIDITTINFRLKERMVIRYNVIQLSGYIACDCIGYPDTLNFIALHLNLGIPYAFVYGIRINHWDSDISDIPYGTPPC